jgi:hypothetical protein
MSCPPDNLFQPWVAIVKLASSRGPVHRRRRADPLSIISARRLAFTRLLAPSLDSLSILIGQQWRL